MKRLALASTALLAAIACAPGGADARGFGGGGFHGGAYDPVSCGCDGYGS